MIVKLKKTAFEARVLPLDWKQLTVSKVESAAPKNPKPGTNTVNHFVTFIIADMFKNDGSPQTHRHLFNTGAMWKIADFAAALAGQPKSEVHDSIQGDEIDFDLEKIIGQKCWGKFTPDILKDGTPTSVITQWAPADKVPF